MAAPRVCLVSEALAGVADEGTKCVAHELVRHLRPLCDLHAIAVGAAADKTLSSVQRSRSFLLRDLARQMRRLRPDVVCYLPTAALTASATLRARLLSLYAGAPVALVALQQREQSGLARNLIQLAKPGLLVVQNQAQAEHLRSAGFRVTILPPAVDSKRFQPAGLEERRRLRAHLGLDPAAFTVLHVGHIKAKRNVEVLAELARSVQVAFVAGETMGSEPELRAQLEESGVRIFSGHQGAIEEFYQAADCYLFPVISKDGAIEIPLSILEAMATNLPVITTRFGSVPQLLGECPGLVYVDTSPAVLQAVAANEQLCEPKTREAVLAYTWPRVAETLLRDLESLRQASGRRLPEAA